MALSPSIPTSFVPKQPVAPSRRPRSSGSNVFLLVSLLIAGLAILASGAIYAYAAYLTNIEKSKAAQVATAESAVNPTTVEQFIRLRDRLSAGDLLLNQHVQLSKFFTLLESITIQNVHFSSLKITVAADNSAAIEMTGAAADFNALAAESTAFAGQKDIKNAIFSGIQVNKDGSVAFTLDATLDPALVVESSAPTTPVLLPASTSTTTPVASSLTTAPLSTSTAPATKTATSSTTKP